MKGIVWVEESNGKPTISHKRKRRVGKRKIEFLGWASRPLIDFLEAIGQDTGAKHSRHDVATFITKYINDKGLASAEKKKKVLCDERLHALFGKKSVSRIKVYDMLEEHFADNHDDDSDSDEELLYSSEEDYKEKCSLGSKYTTGQMKKFPKTPKSCFAAVIPENIKLIYLKKSLIQELLKDPESFELKLVGSFVRMKTDPNDIYQKNRFQLQQVTGVENVSGAAGDSSEFHLKVSNFFKDVPICTLSDDNFSEDEIEDLRNRVKAGLLKRLTLEELELKAQMLHADITKHWIVKEISLLQKLIDRANEKGWRREYFTLFEYLERRKMLQTPSEQEKLLHKIPEVIAEELVPEGTADVATEKAEGSGGSPKSILRGSSDASSTDASGSGDILAPSQVIFSDLDAIKVQYGGIDSVVPVENPNGDPPADNIEQGTYIADVSSGVMEDVISGQEENQEKQEPTTAVIDLRDARPGEKEHREKQEPTTAVIDLSDACPGEKEHREKQEPTTTVIDLSDDESEDEDQISGERPDDVIWHYADPQGRTQGPFSLSSLKRWSDANYFHSGFIVWKTGLSSDDGVLLVDVLRQTFPHSYN